MRTDWLLQHVFQTVLNYGKKNEKQEFVTLKIEDDLNDIHLLIDL